MCLTHSLVSSSSFFFGLLTLIYLDDFELGWRFCFFLGKCGGLDWHGWDGCIGSFLFFFFFSSRAFFVHIALDIYSAGSM